MTVSELKTLSAKMDLPTSKNKEELVENICGAMREYERYKKKKLDKYIRGAQLGEKGKEGVAYVVTTKIGTEYAMKTFKKSKSSDKLLKEVRLQQMAASEGIAPNIIDFDTVGKYIVMEKMDRSLYDYIKEQNGNITEKQQTQMIRLHKKLDKANVFHGDSNILNYMFVKNRMYLIDYGLSKEITPTIISQVGSKTPNLDILTLGIILKLKELKCPPSSYNILKTVIKKNQQEQFNL